MEGMMNTFNNDSQKIQRDILSLLAQRNSCSLGDIAMELKCSFDRVLNNVMALKQLGLIEKKNHQHGYFSLTNELSADLNEIPSTPL